MASDGPLYADIYNYQYEDQDHNDQPVFHLSPQVKQFIQRTQSAWIPNSNYQVDERDNVVGWFYPNDFEYPMVTVTYHNNTYTYKYEPHPQSLIIHDRFQLLRKLGQGMFGITFLAEDMEEDRLVALKAINMEKLQGKGFNERMIQNEVSMLARITEINGFEYMAKYYGSFTDKINGINTLFIITEYIEGQTLKQLIESGSIEPTILWPMYTQLCLGLQHLHHLRIAHRDIKPDNIMVTPEYRIKYIDFGLSCIQDCAMDHCTNNCERPYGTIAYLPPELQRTSGYPRPLDFDAYLSHDIWSLGLTMYYMANQALPYSDPVNSKYELDGDHRTDNFLKSVIVFDWKDRPLIDDVISMLNTQITSKIWIPPTN